MIAEREIAAALAAGDTKRAAYWQTIKDAVDQAPPLTERQRERLAALLNSPH